MVSYILVWANTTLVLCQVVQLVLTGISRLLHCRYRWYSM